MLEREEIFDDQLVVYEDKKGKKYGYILNVRDAKESGVRSEVFAREGELAYDIYWFATNKIETGICEHSGMTTEFLSPTDEATIELEILDKINGKEKEIIEIQKEQTNFYNYLYNYYYSQNPKPEVFMNDEEIIKEISEEIIKVDELSETVTWFNGNETLQEKGDEIEKFLILHSAKLKALVNKIIGEETHSCSCGDCK